MTLPSAGRVRTAAGVRVLAVLLFCLLALALGAVAVFVLPPHLAPRSAFTNAGDAVRAQNDVRGVMVQVAGGLVLLVGAYVTWRQLQLSRESMRQTMEATNAQLKAAQDQLSVDRESQLTQRFAQAVDQLGSEQIVVRIGGIYALERVAKNSAADAGAVAELLCSYIRQHSPAAADGAVREASSVSAPVHLEGADLSHADLRDAHLDGASLAGSEMTGARLRGAHPEGASPLGVLDLDHAQLEGAVADDKTVWPEQFSPREAGITFVSADD